MEIVWTPKTLPTQKTKPIPDEVLLMAEFLHQLIGSLSHYLQGLYIPGGAGFLPSTV